MYNIINRSLLINLISALCFINFSCIRNDSVEKALQLAENNRQELEKVIAHYRGEQKKLKAAEFLIRNMPIHYGYENPKLDSLMTVMAQTAKNHFVSKETKTKWKDIFFFNTPKVYDIKTLKADYLIENIDLAFHVYEKYAWNKNLPLDDFFELILPYRIGDEPISNWRRSYYDRYSKILDSLYIKGTDVVEACNILAKKLQKENFFYTTDFNTPHLNAKFLLENRIGYCRESCDIAVYAMRACGIPVTTDGYIYSPEYQQGHTWNVVRDTSGRYLSFWYLEFKARRDMKDDGRKKGKVFRECFGVQPEKIRGIRKNTAVPPLFRHKLIKDVSSNYTGNNALEINVSNKEIKILYLGIFSPSGWEPIDIAEVKNRKAIFKAVEKDIIYQPLYCDQKKNNALMHADYPFLFENDSIKYLIPKGTREKAIISRKMPLMQLFKDILYQNTLNSKFEVSNSIDFVEKELLYEIKDSLNYNYYEIPISTKQAYRYMRYSPDYNRHIELAELGIFEKDKSSNSPITLNVIKKRSNDDGNFNPENLIDGNILTFTIVKDTAKSVVFDMSKKVMIERLFFSPRNDDNFVWKGDVYELFCNCGSKGWKSLGEKTAQGNIITYDVPSNALLWLRNKTKGKEEQIFIMRNGKQTFIYDIGK